MIIADRSARQIVPQVLGFANIESVVDLGCGPARWLATYKEFGVKEILGVDFEAKNKTELQIDESEFLTHNLSEPISIDRRFDLAMSLEVAEHLPETSSDNIVGSLTSLSDLVLFSAAIPFQGGTNHINEQWPEYWAEKFRAKGYIAIDSLRDNLWHNKEVAYWYAQNMLLFVKEEKLSQYPKLIDYAKSTNQGSLSRVHPKMFLKTRESLSQPTSILVRKVWDIFPRKLRFWLAKHFEQQFWYQVNTAYPAVSKK